MVVFVVEEYAPGGFLCGVDEGGAEDAVDARAAVFGHDGDLAEGEQGEEFGGAGFFEFREDVFVFCHCMNRVSYFGSGRGCDVKRFLGGGAGDGDGGGRVVIQIFRRGLRGWKRRCLPRITRITRILRRRCGRK